MQESQLLKIIKCQLLYIFSSIIQYNFNLHRIFVLHEMKVSILSPAHVAIQYLLFLKFIPDFFIIRDPWLRTYLLPPSSTSKIQ